VQWVVLTARSTLSADQLTTLRDRYAGNARPRQDLNGRPLHADEPDPGG